MSERVPVRWVDLFDEGPPPHPVSGKLICAVPLSLLKTTRLVPDGAGGYVEVVTTCAAQTRAEP